MLWLKWKFWLWVANHYRKQMNRRQIRTSRSSHRWIMAGGDAAAAYRAYREGTGRE